MGGAKWRCLNVKGRLHGVMLTAKKLNMAECKEFELCPARRTFNKHLYRNNDFLLNLTATSLDHWSSDLPVETALQGGSSGGKRCKRDKGNQQRRKR